MFTPQQIDQISFGRSTFGGYDMQQVDEFLEPLTEDYVTLYKENALLKSKMRVSSPLTTIVKLQVLRTAESPLTEMLPPEAKPCISCIGFSFQSNNVIFTYCFCKCCVSIFLIKSASLR